MNISIMDITNQTQMNLINQQYSMQDFIRDNCFKLDTKFAIMGAILIIGTIIHGLFYDTINSWEYEDYPVGKYCLFAFEVFCILFGLMIILLVST